MKETMPKAVILAGGRGSRLSPVTDTLPKPLVPVCGMPVMTHILRLLARCGVTEATVTLHYLGQKIEGYYGARAEGIELRYAYETEPLGTAGGVLAALGEPTEEILVISGDALCDFDLAAACRFHREKGADATLILAKRENVTGLGVVLTEDGGKIAAFGEKPSPDVFTPQTVNTGVYLLSPRILSLIPRDTPYDFGSDLFPGALKAGMNLYGYADGGYWQDMGTLDALYDCTMAGARGEIPHLCPGADALTLPGCVIGKGVKVGKGAAVEESVLFDRVTVGENARICHAILCEGVCIGAGAAVNPATVIGADTRVGEGLYLPGQIKIHAGSRLTVKSERNAGEAPPESVTPHPADPYAPAARSTVAQEQTGTGREIRQDSGAKPFPGSRESYPFDGYMALADRFDGEGIDLSGQEGVDLLFLTRLARGAAQTVRPLPVGISDDGSGDAKAAAAQIAAAVACCGATVLDMGTCPPDGTAFLSAELGCGLAFAVSRRRGKLYTRLYDSAGLYPPRETEKQLEKNLFWEADGDAPFPGSGKVLSAPIAEPLLVSALGRYHLLPAAVPGVAPEWYAEGREARGYVPLLTAVMGGAPCSDADRDGVLRFALCPNNLFEVTEMGVTYTGWHAAAILLQNGYPEQCGEIALPRSAPGWLAALCGDLGYETHLLPQRGDCLGRALAARYPYLLHPLLLMPALVSVMKRSRATVAELCRDLPAFHRLSAEMPLRRGEKQMLFSALSHMEEPDREPTPDRVRLHFEKGEVTLYPCRRSALRIMADAADAEAAQELYADAVKQIRSRIRPGT